MERFGMRYDRWCGWLLGALGHGRRLTRIELDAEQLHVRMGWGFRGTVPRDHIVAATPSDGRVYGWGVHGWRGRWLVNGSSRGIVVLDIEPAVPAQVLFVPIRLRQLALSLEDRDAFLVALGVQPAVS